MLSGMSSRMLEEWRAFAALEPFGDDRADFRIGQLTAIVANATRVKGSRVRTWTDFAYRDKNVNRVANDEDMLAYVKNLHVMYTAVWDKKNGNKSK